MADYTLTPTQSTDLDLGIDNTMADDQFDADLDGLVSTLDDGQCPWCESYAGEHPTMHAPKAHPDRWQAFTEARDG